MGQTYFAHISQTGAVKYEQVPGSIGVLEMPDKPMPIGEATCRTWDENGLAVWTLRIGKEEIPGRWIIVDPEILHALIGRWLAPISPPFQAEVSGRDCASSLLRMWL